MEGGGAFEFTYTSTSNGIKDVILRAGLGTGTSATAGVEVIYLSPGTLLCRVRTLTFTRVVTEIFWCCALFNP